MSNKRAPGRFLDEWMDLVTECRQSDLADAAWCNEHRIFPGCFYNEVTRLRKKPVRYRIQSEKPALLILHPIIYIPFKQCTFFRNSGFFRIFPF